jgi:hypothetical protein
MPERFTTSYKADTFKTLEQLRGSCQRDEGDLTGKIVVIQKALTDGVPSTAFIFEEVKDVGSVGHDLVVVQFTTEADRQSLKALHETVQKETFLCEGQAYLNGNEIKVLAFRAKPK